jgi:hypothetical protein
MKFVGHGDYKVKGREKLKRLRLKYMGMKL